MSVLFKKAFFKPCENINGRLNIKNTCWTYSVLCSLFHR